MTSVGDEGKRKRILPCEAGMWLDLVQLTEDLEAKGQCKMNEHFWEGK